MAETCEEARHELYRLVLAGRVRLTRPRRALIDLLLEGSSKAETAASGFSADELTAELNRREAGIVSRATVYRCLELLEGIGLLERSEGPSRLSWSLKRNALSSLSFIDAAAERIDDLPSLLPALERFIARIAPPGFKLESAVLRVYGKFEEPRPAKQKKRGRGIAMQSDGRQ